jgi:trehalose synthase
MASRFRIGQAAMGLHRDVSLQSAQSVRFEDYDAVIVHDPQPLWLIERRSRQKWIWCCHIDLSTPDPDVWSYLAPTANRYDAVVFSLPEYGRQPLTAKQRFIKPAIDPFSAINDDLPSSEGAERLQRYGIPTDLPLVVQVGRFDKWKDPHGVIEAFCMAAAQTPATLVLAGNTADDDPEGPAMHESICAAANDRVVVIDAHDPLLVNALQRRAAVVLQKSVREGFGLTVAEAMWKGKPVIGGETGGITLQVLYGQTGYTVNSVEGLAFYVRYLLNNPSIAEEMGRRGRERVRQNFLITRHVEDYLSLMTLMTRT